MKNRITSFLPSRTFSSPFSRLPLSYLLLTFLTLFAGSVASAQIPSSGLVGYWPFNGNANDESGNGNNGTVNGATLTTDRFGNANSAYSFNGNTIDVNSGNQFAITQSSQFTVNFWYYTNSQASPVHFLGKRSTTVANLNWQFAYNIGSGQGLVFNGALGGCSTGSQITLGQWEMLTGVFNNGTWSIYRNGNFINSTSANVQSDLGNLLKIGNAGSADPFYGKLDDISIYNSALTPAEITQLYTDQTSTVATPPCPTLATNLQTGLVGYWPFCGNANDESGNGNNGTVNGATLTTDRFGNANSAYSFDGVNTSISVSDNISLDILNEISISCWFKKNNFNNKYEYLIGKEGAYNGNQCNYKMQFAANDNNLGFYADPRGISGCILNNCLPVLNTVDWFHVVGVSRNDSMFFYLNGNQVWSSLSLSSQTLVTNNLPLMFGKAPFSDPNQPSDPFLHYDGKIDDISIYNRALTPAEIAQLYTDQTSLVEVPCTPFLGEDLTVCAGTSVALSASSTSSSAACPTLPSNLQTGLVGYWPFCGNANDASGNGNNGTVNGATLTTDRFDNANSAYSFDGVNDVISAPRTNLSSFSVSAWVHPATADCFIPVLDAYPNSWEIIDVCNSGRLSFIIFLPQGETLYSTNVPLNPNTWYHIVATYDAQNLKIYVNGSLVLNQNTIPIPNVNGLLNFGASISGNSQYLSGKLDDISLHNRALTAAETQQLYTLGQSTYLWSNGATTSTINVTPTTTTTYTCTVTDANGNVCTDSVTVFVPQIEASDLTICAGETTTLSVSGINSTATPSACATLPANLQSGLVGYWPFCGNANDASGNGNNGNVGTQSLIVDRFNIPDRAYNFNRDYSKIQLPNSILPIAPTSFSISLWLKPEIMDTYGVSGNYSGDLICDRNTSTWFYKYRIMYDQWNNGERGIRFYSTNENSISGLTYNYFPQDMNWIHVVVTSDYSLNIKKMYFNGVLVDLDSSPISYPNHANATTIGGNSFPGNLNGDPSFLGSIDDLAFWNRALSPSEILQLYTPGLPSYLWSNGATTPTINISPTTTTTYTCTITTNGVSCTDTVTVVVSNPIIDLGADVTVCGTSTTLTAPSGYDSYSWSNGATTNTTTVTANGTYSCTVTQGGCSATDGVDVTLVNASVSASDSTVCAGQSVTLSVPQAGSTSTACAALPINLQTGLVGYWPFCGNANDASGNGNNGTVNGATLTTDRFGNANSAYSFDGVSSVINIFNSTTLSFPNNITISAWVYRQSNSILPEGIFGPATYLPNQPGYFLRVIDNKLNLSISQPYVGGQSNQLISSGQWYFVSGTYDNNSIKTYVNGILSGETIVGSGYLDSWASSNPLTIGQEIDYASTNLHPWNGFLDDIGIWNRALTANEIQEIFIQNATTYIWSNGATTPTINVSPTSTTTYTCTITTNGVSCTDEVTVVVSQPVASITPNGLVEICEGQSIALTANGGVSYLWNTGAPTQSITVNTEAFYTVTVTDENGCTDTESQLVKVNFLPNIGVNNASICLGQSTTLTATGGLSYVWSPATGLSSTTGTTVTASPSTSTLYTVTGTGANGCTNTATAAVAVNAAPTATITPATATTFCQGGSVVLNANTGAGLSYQWFNNAVAISGATSSSYTANASGSYTVVVTNTSTCSATSTATVVTVNALPTATITASSATTFCQGGSVVLNANTGTGLSYQWRLNGTNITGATSSSYTANASGSYTVVVTNTSTCSATSTATVVTVNALPTATITPATATTFCQGGSVVLNANNGAGLSYQWRLNGTNITGATSSSYTANASGSYTVVVTNTSTCSSTSTATVVTANALPAATITPATATTFCQGGSVVLNANTGAGLSYQWFNNTVAISGATSSSYTANASGSYTVVVTNTSTCSATSTATVVTVNALPTATITASSATTFCQGGSVVLNANTGTGLTYQWRLNGTNITGATSSTYTANASGSFTVVVTNTSTCSSTSTSTVVTVNPLPTATITPTTATTFCQGGSVVLNANTGTGLSYQWRLNGTNISGATTASYTANASGSYTVVVTNASTCSATSAATVVTVNALPIATITPATTTTFCQGGSVVLNANTGTGLSYQWRLNGTNITGATTSTYTANASGSYTVVVTNTSTCSATSSAINVTAVPNVNYYADADGDGFGDAATVISTCVQPQGYVTDNTDCDDTSADVNPAAAEVCNHIDDDCSGTIDDGLVFDTYYADVDGDTFGDANNSIYECSQPSGYVTNNTDCNDNNANQNTASTEICNGEDDDCDGAIDNGLIFLDYYADLDSDGFGAGAATNSCVDLGAGYVNNNTDCNDNNANQNTASTEICNGEDDDCDGVIDNGIIFLDYYADLDSDGFGAGAATNSCVDLGAGYVTNNTDCDDSNSNINSSATETCNSIDDNCDGQIDEGITFFDYYADTDGDGFGAGDVITSCSDLGAGYVSNNTDCDDSNSNINSSATETCNTIDDNCDGQIDEGVQTVYFIDNDGDTYGNPSVSILACTQPIGYTPDDTDCNDTDASINPGAEDIGGNGIDENCDGEIDNSIFELNATISLYPNPTRSELNIQINSSIIGNDLYIFDAVGKLVFKQQLLSTNTSLSVETFANGNYIVRIGEVVKRFEVIK